MTRNNLIITNLDELLDYHQKDDHYLSPFEIISELEKQIKYLNHVRVDYMTVDYKFDGICMFELKSFKKERGSITYNFEFTGFAS